MEKIYFGFVEDNNDPLKIGRVRVRVVGIHTENREDIPTSHLPWCSCILPVNSASAVKPPEQGSQVVLTALDDSLQIFLVLGVVPGIIDEPDTSRIARNESIDETIVQSKSDQRLTGDINEPDSISTYNALYPRNFVIDTPGGHVFELDDTPGFERVQLYHEAGSYIEMTNDGNAVMRSNADLYVINTGTRYDSIGGMYQMNAGSEYKITSPTVTIEGTLNVSTGASGTFSASGFTITVQNGIITNIA